MKRRKAVSRRILPDCVDTRMAEFQQVRRYRETDKLCLDFKTVESTPILRHLTNDKQTLRIAVFSILLPEETILHYRTIANYLGEKVQRPVI